MRLILDTSAYSAFKRNHPGVFVAIRRADEILLPSTVHGELLAGFETGSRTEENRASLHEFLKSPRVKLVPAGMETAERYARIYAYLRSQGRPIPTNDLWIAASAMEHSAELLTFDEHFKHVAQIIVRFIE